MTKYNKKRVLGFIMMHVMMAGYLVAGCGAPAAEPASGEGTVAETLSEDAGNTSEKTGDVAETVLTTETDIPESVETAEEVEPVPADIVVERVPGISEDFITGADLSSYVSLKNSGVQFFDYEGNPLDDQGFFDFLADCGMNYVRVRIWNDPTDGEGHGYGGGNCDQSVAEKIGVWATKAGMKVLLDYHCSDFWTNPGKQNAPKAWKDYSADQKAEALKEFISASMEDLLNLDVNIGMVQVGNETVDGIAGEHEWPDMCKLFQAGSEAVRETAKAHGQEILVAIHFTNPEKGSYPEYAGYLKKYEVDYDVFGSSYYPYWHGTPEDLATTLKDISDTFDKKVAVLETSYIHTYADGDGHPNTESEGKAGDKFFYSIDEQGQADAIRTVANAVASVGDAGLGFFWWEPAWIPVGVYPSEEVLASLPEDATFHLPNNMTLDDYVQNRDQVLQQNKEAWETYGSGWATSYAGDYDADAAEWYGGSAVDNEAIFDFWGSPLSTARIFSYIRTGTVAPLKVTGVLTEDVNLEVNSAFNIPDKCYVTYNDGFQERAMIQWDEAEVALVDMTKPGDYTFHGTVDGSKLMHLNNASGEVSREGMDRILSGATMKLSVKKANLVQNPGFEEEDMSMWEISTDIISRKNDGNNVHDGDYCLHFWDKNPIEYTVEQKITLDKGTYTLGAYLEGGDAGPDAAFKIYAVVDGTTYETETMVTKWQEWKNPEVKDLVIGTDQTEITIGIYGKCAGGGWGAWDDFYLY